jgi:hypothetical protein
MEIGDRILVFNRPVRVAYGTHLDASMRAADRSHVQREIMRVLSVEQTKDNIN